MNTESAYTIEPGRIPNTLTGTGWIVYKTMPNPSHGKQTVAMFPEVTGETGRAFTNAAEFVKVSETIDAAREAGTR